MPPNNQKYRIPKSDTPGRPLIYDWPQTVLGIQWGQAQDMAYDTYVLPTLDRINRRISMPSIVRLVYDQTMYDSAPVSTQYTGYNYVDNNSFDWQAAYGIAIHAPVPGMPGFTFLGYIPSLVAGTVVTYPNIVWDYPDGITVTLSFGQTPDPNTQTSLNTYPFTDTYAGNDPSTLSVLGVSAGATLLISKCQATTLITNGTVTNPLLLYDGNCNSAPFLTPVSEHQP